MNRTSNVTTSCAILYLPSLREETMTLSGSLMVRAELEVFFPSARSGRSQLLGWESSLITRQLPPLS